MKILYLDCFSGISGDMLVGALSDLGVLPSTFEWELSKVDLGAFHMHFERQSRQNVHGIKFGIHEGTTHTHDQDEHMHEQEKHVHEPEKHMHEQEKHVHEQEKHVHEQEKHVHEQEKHSHELERHSHKLEEHSHELEEHSHEHGEHSHGRNHREIRALIENSGLSAFVKEKSLAVFQRIAVAEGKIHGVSPENVTFHEVGALDSIADIICACAGIEALGVEKVIVSKLFEGSGWIDCAHGRFPLPAPATLEILATIPFSQIDEPFEFITPTGAALVAEFGSGFSTMPPLQVEKVGYGIGSRKLHSRPNVLRAVLAEVEDGPPTNEQVVQIETNLDDLSPELTGTLIDRCLQAGALEAFLTPVQMKKNRPGVLLTVLAASDHEAALIDLLFRETTTFGVRISRKKRVILERSFENLTTPHGEIRIKIGRRNGQIVQRTPEFESCREAAATSGESLRVVYAAAQILR